MWTDVEGRYGSQYPLPIRRGAVHDEDRTALKENLGIPVANFVIIFRESDNEYKDIELIRSVLASLGGPGMMRITPDMVGLVDGTKWGIPDTRCGGQG